MNTKWTRKRPRFYTLFGTYGKSAEIERGGETGRWWWQTSKLDHTTGRYRLTHGREHTLKLAKQAAEQELK